jgi:hypothetical protein
MGVGGTELYSPVWIWREKAEMRLRDNTWRAHWDGVEVPKVEA